jgi:hypothetical protein
MRYAPYFCEENVWHLAGDPTLPSPRFAVFVSGPQGVAMWGQRAAAGRDPLVWDYHVFVIADAAGAPQVWDLDTVLGMPLPLEHYLARSFRPAPAGVTPRFRVVDADTYRAVFSSDRAHMRAPDGRELQPFPPWPRIGDGGSNLARFLDMDDAFVGERHDLASLRARFASKGNP